MDHIIKPLRSDPGIQRDGTLFDSTAYTDGEWVRFYRGLPRKIGGYRQISAGNTSAAPSIARGLYTVPYNTGVQMMTGYNDGAWSTQVTQNGLTSAPVPLFSGDPTGQDWANPDNLWQFQLVSSIAANGTGRQQSIVAFPGHNLSNINSDDESLIYYMPVGGNALEPLPAGLTCSGGILSTAPYFMFFGNDGVVGWFLSTEIGDMAPASLEYASIGTGTKLVKGTLTRGGNNTPSGLLWSIDALMRYNFVGGDLVFRFDVIQDELSLLSSSCVVQYGQLYYWIGNDEFYVYNGVVQPVPNFTNRDFFFNNLNFDQQQKVWGIAIPRWKEIWWFFPMGDSLECNHAIIFNVEMGIWYDTPISRSCGYRVQRFRYPIMADTQMNNGNYPIWMHEFGTDKLIDGNAYAIPARIESNIMMIADTAPTMDAQIRTRRIEPDLVQSGQMSLTVRQRGFANSIPQDSPPYYFDNTTEAIDVALMGRQVSFVFESNEAGGNFQVGKTLLNYTRGDSRPSYTVFVDKSVDNLPKQGE